MFSYSLTLLGCGSLFYQEKKYGENINTRVFAVSFYHIETPNKSKLIPLDVVSSGLDVPFTSH